MIRIDGLHRVEEDIGAPEDGNDGAAAVEKMRFFVFSLNDYGSGELNSGTSDCEINEHDPAFPAGSSSAPPILSRASPFRLGLEALGSLNSGPFALIVCDPALPDLDASELHSRLTDEGYAGPDTLSVGAT